MRSFTIFLALAAQAHSQDVGDKLLDKLVDKLFQKVGSLANGDMDETTLGKPGQLAMPTKANLQVASALPQTQRFHGGSLQKSQHMSMSNPRLQQCLTNVHAAASIGASHTPSRHSRSVRVNALGKDEPVVVIGVAADSGCGKSTFMRRLVNVFGGDTVGPLGGGFGNGGWETNTLVSDQTTVLCLDDYHLNDRNGRKVSGLTALNTKEQKFDLMYEQLAALKRGEEVKKPIYNHVNGTLDTPETIKPTPIVIIEGLHPFVDPRVRELLDFSIYLDISDDVKFAWKIQRDMEERGWTLDEVKAQIEARKPDFDAYVAPQRADSDLVIQVLPTELTKDDTGKILKVKFIQRTGQENFEPAYIFDKGSSVTWVPCGKTIACDFPGIKMASYPDTFFDKPVTVLEMDGQFNNVEELCYIENQLSNLDTKSASELTQSMVKNKGSPGSNNGSGFFQSLAALKLRALYEKISGKKVTPA
jgi:phosphoribulokinase